MSKLMQANIRNLVKIRGGVKDDSEVIRGRFKYLRALRMRTFVMYVSKPLMRCMILEAREDVPGQHRNSICLQGGAANRVLEFDKAGLPIFVLGVCLYQ